MVRVGFRQVLGVKRLVGLGALALVPSVIAFVVVRDRTNWQAFVEFHEAPFYSLTAIALPVIALILGGSALGEERRDHTLSFLVLRPIRRETVIAAKLLAGWAGTVAVIGAGAVAAGLVMQFVGGWSEVLLPLVVATAISSLGYAAVFLILGYLTSRAVLYGLAYVFVWELGISGAVESLASVSLFRIGLSAYVDLLPRAAGRLRDVLGNVTPGVWGATAKVAVVAVIAVAVGGVLLRRRDIT
jgi:ABC-2 type transport system permease protein